MQIKASANGGGERSGNITIRTASGLTRTVSLKQEAMYYGIELSIRYNEGCSLSIYRGRGYDEGMRLCTAVPEGSSGGIWDNHEAFQDWAREACERYGDTLYSYTEGRCIVYLGNGETMEWELQFTDSPSESGLTYLSLTDEGEGICKLTMKLCDDDAKYLLGNGKEWGATVVSSMFWKDGRCPGYFPVSGFESYTDENALYVSLLKNMRSKEALIVTDDDSPELSGYNGWKINNGSILYFLDATAPVIINFAGTVGDGGLSKEWLFRYEKEQKSVTMMRLSDGEWVYRVYERQTGEFDVDYV